MDHKNKLLFALVATLIILLSVCHVCLAPTAQAKQPVALTTAERTWLAAHPVIRVSNSPDYAPFDFVEDDQPTGFSVDYLELLARRVGLRLDFIQNNWDNTIKLAKEKKIDLVHTLFHTKERDAFLLFTPPYKTVVNAIFIREGVEGVKKLADLAGRRVALVKGDYLTKAIMQVVPDGNYLFVDTYEDVVKALSLNKADATVMDSAVANYLTRKLTLTNIIPVGEANISVGDFDGQYRLAVRKDWPELRSILQKAMKTITRDEMAELEARWFGKTRRSETGRNLPLTQSERIFLNNHPQITIGIMDAWPPLDFKDSSGRPAGIGVEYIKALNARLGGVLKTIPGPFKDNLDQVREKKLDALMDVTPKPEREKFLNFTRVYMNIPHVIIARADAPNYANEADLKGKTLALERGFYNNTWFKKNYPSVKIIQYPDTAAALDAVARREADAYAGNRAVASWIIQNELLTSLRIKGRLTKPGSVLAIGVRKDWPELASILDKALADISTQERSAFNSRWVTVNLEGQTSGKGLSFTKAEQNYIHAHPLIKINGGPWPPFIIRDKGGRTRGISTDIIRQAAELAGLELEFVNGPWPQMVDMLKNGQLDMLQCLSKTPEREAFVNFTEPYLTLTEAIIVRKEETDVHILADLEGKKLAVEKGSRLEELIGKSQPGIRLVPVDSVLEGLGKVRGEKATAFIGTQIAAQYLMQKHLMGDLKIAGYGEQGGNDLRLGAGKDAGVLVGIMQKALAAISESQKAKIIGRYVAAGDETGQASENVPAQGNERDRLGRISDQFSPTGVLIIAAAIFLTIALLAVILIRAVRKENIAVNFGSARFRWLVLSALSIFVIVVALLGWFSLERHKKVVLNDARETLLGIISISQDRLNLWLEERLAQMEQLARNPELAEATKLLLTVEPTRDNLLKSTELQRVRSFFKTTRGIFPNIGFFIIDPERISIGSMRDGNVGTTNLIAKQHPELVARAFQGEVAFVPPMTSDVQLEKPSDSKTGPKPPTMFFIGPVQDSAGRILAVMTLRVDPWKDLGRAMKIFDSSGTGETYIFDRHGRMLTASRFEGQLRRIGLLQEGKSSTLNLLLRDPGVNLVDGGRPTVERSKQPLTYMVSRALALKREQAKAETGEQQPIIQTDLTGRRDYRGVPVFSAWCWCSRFDMGLAAEVDQDAALASFHQIRATVFGILGFTMLLSVGAVLFVLIIGERTSRALLRARDDLEDKVAERTAELKDNQERFAALLEGAPDAIVVTNEQGKIILINSQSERLFGYSRQTLIGQSVDVIFPKEARGEHSANRDHVLADRQAHTIGAGLESKVKSKDGRLVPVDIGLSPLSTAEGVLLVESIRDITDRKQMEEALSDERERLQLILDTSPVGVAFGTGGKIRFANPRFREMFDLNVGDEVPNMFVNPEDETALNQKLAAEGRLENQELKLYGRNREVREMLVSYLPINYEGQDGNLTWMMDITDRKKIEREIKEKFEELSRLWNLAVGRELKMIDLKKEINDLLGQMGQDEKYKIVSADAELPH